MSLPPGTYLGGVRSVECLRQRCHIDEETGCWLWRGAASVGSPRVWAFDPERGCHRTMTGAQAAWILGGGSPIKGRTVYHARCTEWLCVNKAHLAIGTKAEAGAHVKSTGQLRGLPGRVALNTRNSRKRSKYTPELRALILASDEPGTHLSARIGIPHTTISYVRRGERWAEGVTGSSVFNWASAR